MAQGGQEGGNSRVISQRYEERKTNTGAVCCKCNLDKDLDCYGANKSWCLECVRKYQKEYRKKRSYKLW